MKLLTFAFAVLFTSVICQGNAVAGNWEKYLAVESHFYVLDHQNFNQVHCKLHSSDIDNMARMIRAAAAQMPGQPQVDVNPEDYAITYDRKNGLSIKSPTLTIGSISASTGSLSSAQQQELERAHAGFHLIVHAIDNVLKQLFKGLEAPQPGQMDILYVNTQDGMDTVAYIRNNLQYVLTFKNKKITIKTKRGATTMKMVKYYDSLPDGKLLEDRESVNIKNFLTTNTINSKLTYQSINGFMFPATVMSKTHTIMPNVQQETQVDVELKSCNVI